MGAFTRRPNEPVSDAMDISNPGGVNSVVSQFFAQTLDALFHTAVGVNVLVSPYLLDQGGGWHYRASILDQGVKHPGFNGGQVDSQLS